MTTRVLSQMFSNEDMCRMETYLNKLLDDNPFLIEEQSPQEIAFDMLEVWKTDDLNVDPNALYKIQLLSSFCVQGCLPENVEQEFVFAGFLLFVHEWISVVCDKKKQ